MNKIFKLLPLAAAIALASCTKDAPSKSEVEAGFAKYDGPMPTVTISDKAESDPMAGKATVEVTFTGLSNELKGLSFGVLSDTDPTFADAKFTKLVDLADGTVKVDAKVSAGKTNYIRGVVAFEGGTVFSDVLEVAVADVPFYTKIPGKYTGEIYSYGTEEDITVTWTIVADTADPEHKCRIYGIEPYYYSKGYGKDTNKKLNSVEGVIDPEARTITIKDRSYISLSTSTDDYFVRGVDAPKVSDAEYYADLVLQLDADCLSFNLVNGFQTITISVETGESDVFNQYDGGVTFSK